MAVLVQVRDSVKFWWSKPFENQRRAIFRFDLDGESLAGAQARRQAYPAQGGEILLSSLFKELTESAGDIQFGEGQEVELKGLAGVNRVYTVNWQTPGSTPFTSLKGLVQVLH